VQAIVAKVMTERPVPLSTIRNTVPAAVEDTVLTALAKLPADRFSTAAEFSAALGTGTTAQAKAFPPARKRARDPLVIGLGAAAVAFAAIAGLVAMKSPFRADLFPYHMEITSPDAQVVGFADVSPDGGTLAFVARDTASQNASLYVRRLDELATRIVPGTQAVQGASFSPDGKWIAYVSGRRALMKVPVDGGSPVTLGEVPDFGGLDWSSSGQIVVGAGADELHGGIGVVDADGGPIVELTKVDSADEQLSHQNPIVLADGKTVLFTIWYGNMARAQIAGAQIGDGKVTKTGIIGTQAVGVIDGQLIFTRSDGMLMAVPFDTRTLRSSGTARQIQDFPSMDDAGKGTGHIYLSRSGALIYSRGTKEKRLVWVNAKGEATPALDDLRGYLHLRLSPDGRRAALGITSGPRIDLWALNFAAGTLTRITDDGSTRNPVWSIDGTQIFYVSTKGGRAGFWRASADGSTQPAELGRSRHNNAWNLDITPDRKTFAFNAISNGTFNIETYDVDAPHVEREIAMSPTATEVLSRFSPDGKWIAYQSNESGRFEVYVRSYPENSGRTQVSADGGVKPVWSRDGNHIYYWNNKTMMMAEVSRDPAIRIVSRRALFSGNYLQDFDVAPGGDRMLMIQSQPDAADLVVVPNWATQLKSRVRQ
jgi:serine/threonine-protein kinase